jgi:DNA-directed RNA polymerase specialized sigma24 family protein
MDDEQKLNRLDKIRAILAMRDAGYTDEQIAAELGIGMRKLQSLLTQVRQRQGRSFAIPGLIAKGKKP